MAYRILKYRHTCNLGDAIQTIALSRLLQGHALREVYRDEAHLSSGGAFIINGYLCNKVNAHDHDCLFAGVHIGGNVDAHLEWMSGSRFPLGCRDDYTVDLLAKRGLPGELVGCATLTLPRYEGPRRGEFSLGVRRGGHILSNAIGWKLSWADQVTLGNARLETLKRASLVHTNGLHTVLPCLAFGTPVIFHRADLRGILQPERLRLLDSIGFAYDETMTLDVSRWAQAYRDFLARGLEGEWSSLENTPDGTGGAV